MDNNSGTLKDAVEELKRSVAEMKYQWIKVLRQFKTWNWINNKLAMRKRLDKGN